MGMMDFAADVGAEVTHDWATVPFCRLPEESGRYLDMVVYGTTTAHSENRFNRAVGEKGAQRVPKDIEVDVLLCEYADEARPFKLAVRGAGLVGPLMRHINGIGWPREHVESNEKPGVRVFDKPVLLSIRCAGKKAADVGEFMVYTVGSVVCDDTAAFLRDYRAKAAASGKVRDAQADDEIPF